MNNKKMYVFNYTEKKGQVNNRYFDFYILAANENNAYIKLNKVLEKEVFKVIDFKNCFNLKILERYCF